MTMDDESHDVGSEHWEPLVLTPECECPCHGKVPGEPDVTVSYNGHTHLNCPGCCGTGTLASCRACGINGAVICMECSDITDMAVKLQALATETFALRAAKDDLITALKVEHANHLAHPVTWDCPTCALLAKFDKRVANDPRR
jgi:hypothetical protein